MCINNCLRCFLRLVRKCHRRSFRYRIRSLSTLFEDLTKGRTFQQEAAFIDHQIQQVKIRSQALRHALSPSKPFSQNSRKLFFSFMLKRKEWDCLHELEDYKDVGGVFIMAKTYVRREDR